MIIVKEVSDDYFNDKLYANHTFNRVPFAELNRSVADNDDVRYLIFSDSKIRAGMIVGRRADVLCSPFSAPFGGLIPARETISMECVDAIIDTFADYCRHRGLEGRITLPPIWFDSDLTSKTIAAMMARGFRPTADISYFINLGTDIEISKSARKKLRQASDAGLCFEVLEPSRDNIARVYDILLQNHRSRGYEMRRSLENYIATDAIMQAQYFVITHSGKDIAAAANYTLAPGVTIGAGWGDLPQFSYLRPMNLLASSMIDYYRTHGFNYFDLGPAAENGIVAMGLCAFKESIGALASLKYSFIIK